MSGGDYDDVPRFPGYDREEMGDGHALIGPVAVRGAHPGMTLAVRINAVIPATWGNCLAGGWSSLGQSALRHERPAASFTLDDGHRHHDRPQPFGHTVTLRPFMGVMGMPPDRTGTPSHAAAALLGRQSRLQGTDRRDNALSADSGRRRALFGRRRARRAGRWRSQHHGD